VNPSLEDIRGRVAHEILFQLVRGGDERLVFTRTIVTRRHVIANGARFENDDGDVDLQVTQEYEA
jgi:hypothetical protein